MQYFFALKGRFSLTEECFLMSTQISYLFASQRDTSAPPHIIQTLLRKYVVTEVSNMFFDLRPRSTLCLMQWANRAVQSLAVGRNSQGSNPCMDAFLTNFPVLKPVRPKYLIF